MRIASLAALPAAVLLALAGTGVAQAAGSGCPEGTYSATVSPDGTAVSLIFDAFITQAGDGGPNSDRKECSVSVPLNLPPNQSLGLYQVDYRGYGEVNDKQTGEIQVFYGFGNDARRTLNRRIRHHSGDFSFTERVSPGLMRRVGCGQNAVLNVQISLNLQTNGSRNTPAMMTLDSVDGAPAMVYRFDLKRC